MIPSILIVIGLSIRIAAMVTLKKSFSIYLQPRDNIICHGIYSLIRHPSYTGTMMIVIGLAFIELKICVMYLAYMMFLARSTYEEQIMASNPKYVEYMKTTKRFIPFIY